MTLLVCLSVVTACAAFGAAASFTVMAFLIVQSASFDAFALRMMLKGAIFLTMLGLAVVGLARLRLPAPPDAAPLPGFAGSRSHLPYLIPLVILAAVVTMPRLDKYPAIAPDEAHHLTVARNLVQYGAYASGHPLTGMTYFDDYDSVGAPVIVPVATAFKLFGTGLVQGRVVMACHFMALCAALFYLFKPTTGAPAAAAAVLAMTAQSGSVYLGRTLYGETPGLVWVCVGLLAWRVPPNRTAVCRLILAGVAFGMAVLCKTVLVLVGFAFLGAFAYDRATFRRITVKQLVVPACAALAVLVCWFLVKTFADKDMADSAGATLAAYKDYFVFGFGSVPAALRWLAANPLQWAAAAAAVAVVPVIFHRRYDPAWAVLWLLAIFYVFWWVFFTPARLPRYLWYSEAVAACCAGCLVVAAAVFTAKHNGLVRRMASGAAAVVLAGAFVWNGVREAMPVMVADELKSERDLAQYVRSVPPEQAIVTSSWPVAGLMNFMADRNLQIIETSDVCRPGQLVIVDTMMTPPPANATARLAIGRYTIYEE